ncbi:Uncharacterised protein [Mycobacteroides abscessus subsp. abscessus]|nr:Uncharacterised protein [Mycobacteroides abscessus subsp. abscessus]
MVPASVLTRAVLVVTGAFMSLSPSRRVVRVIDGQMAVERFIKCLGDTRMQTQQSPQSCERTHSLPQLSAWNPVIS